MGGFKLRRSFTNETAGYGSDGCKDRMRRERSGGVVKPKRKLHVERNLLSSQQATNGSCDGSKHNSTRDRFAAN